MKTRTAFAFLVVLGAGSPAIIRADETDVSGSWQVNIDCGMDVATATSFLHIEEDLASGLLTTSIPADCGTLALPDQIVKLPETCDTPKLAGDGQVRGSAVDMPATGFFTSDIVFDEPFQFYEICPVARIISRHHYEGTIVEDETGAGVRLVGKVLNGPVEMLRSDGSICLALPHVDDCTFDMRRNDVPVGQDVTVGPRENVSVTFSRVTASGTAAVTPLSEADGAVPANFSVFGTGDVDIFYDVSTSATTEGPITTCFAYPDRDNDAAVDRTFPALHENDLAVLHEENGVFVDRTAVRDPAGNVICAVTTSLSQLTLGDSTDMDLCGMSGVGPKCVDGRCTRGWCADQPVSRRAIRHIERGCALVAMASTVPKGKGRNRLTRRAQKLWGKASRANLRVANLLSSRCLESLRFEGGVLHERARMLRADDPCWSVPWPEWFDCYWPEHP